MEPPAKRMRIWQSVEVDEEDSEYIKAKQRQQQKFKGRLESIFEKYGSMHESMSDEIDMKTNRVVVDRGHLRRLKRQVGRKEALLLDTLGLAVDKGPKHRGEEEEDEISEDSEDELAPTQPAKSKGGQPESDEPQTKPSDDDAQALRSNGNSSVPQQANTFATSIPQFGALQTPNTPNATTNILPAVQFPQTPAGQQAQAIFYMTLTQGIGELVQRAMIQSGLLPQCPLPPASAAPPPTTPITTTDKIAPATDPKWFFPPLSAAARQNLITQSSPLPIHATASATGQDQVVDTTLPHEREEQLTKSTPLVNETSSMAPPTRLEESSPTRPRRTSPRVEVQRKRTRSCRKYPFTKEDDTYISEKRMIDRLTWPAIKESQAKWKDWPVGTFSKRWAVIKDQNLHLQTSLVASTSDEMPGIENDLDEQAEDSPTQSHHLPTPSSSEHGDGQKEAVESPDATGYPSSAHFDDDELELLSLTGAEADEDQEPFPEDPEDEEISDPILEDEEIPNSLPEDEEILDPIPDDEEIPEDIIIPSIEAGDDFIDEDALQRDLLDNLPLRDATVTPPRQASVHVKTEPMPSSPMMPQSEDPLISYDTVPESDTEEEQAPRKKRPTKKTQQPLKCPICNRTFKTPQTLARHEANPRNTHTHPAPQQKKAPATSLNRQVETSDTEEEDGDDDDLLILAATTTTTTTTTPRIKRETRSPSTSFFGSSFHTPKAVMSSSKRRRSRGEDERVPSAAAGKSDAKARMKLVKQCWKGTGNTTSASKAKRKSLVGMGMGFGGVGGLESSRKRARVDNSSDDDDYNDDDGDDEGLDELRI